MTYDLKITGGTVVDGTNTPGYVGDVGVRDGVIVAVGDAREDAARVIDARGRVVCPGVIDVHTHYDAQILWDRMLTFSPAQGVTTVVIGNCGFGIAPTRPDDRSLILKTLQHVEGIEYSVTREALGDDWGFTTYPDYLDLLERRGSAINLVGLVGHTAVRTWVMGDDASTREATPDEIAQMREIVREAMLAGAAGFSSSDTPAHRGVDGGRIPSQCASYEELEELVMVLAELQMGTFQSNWGPHMTFEGIDCLLGNTGVPLCDPVIRARQNMGHLQLVDFVDRMQAKGYRFFPQIQCIPHTVEVGLHDPFQFALDQPVHTFNAPTLDELFVPVVKMETLEERFEYYKSPGFRHRFRELSDVPEWNRGAWPFILVNRAPTRPELEGLHLVEAATSLGLHPSELMYDLSIESGLEARFGVHSSNTNEDEVEKLLYHDGLRLGAADAGAHVSQEFDYSYPAHLLGHWVRERGFPLERAVAMLTSWEGECYGIADRGVVREGLAADIVVFDPETVAPGRAHCVYDLPSGAARLESLPTGIEWVIVNGTVLSHDGVDEVAPDGELPGRVLRDVGRDPSRFRPVATERRTPEPDVYPLARV